MSLTSPDASRHHLSSTRTFGRYLLVYGAIWASIMAVFITVSHPLLKAFADRQVNARLISNAALIDEYMDSAGPFTISNREELDLFCKRLRRPTLEDTWVTLFTDKKEVLADSRIPNPVAEGMRPRPEVSQALKNSIGSSIRYSDMAHCRMALLAMPHHHLGEVQGVVRIGVPYASIDDSLWWAYIRIATAGLGLSVIAAALSSLYWNFINPSAN